MCATQPTGDTGAYRGLAMLPNAWRLPEWGKYLYGHRAQSAFQVTDSMWFY